MRYKTSYSSVTLTLSAKSNVVKGLANPRHVDSYSARGIERVSRPRSLVYILLASSYLRGRYYFASFFPFVTSRNATTICTPDQAEVERAPVLPITLPDESRLANAEI